MQSIALRFSKRIFNEKTIATGFAVSRYDQRRHGAECYICRATYVG